MATPHELANFIWSIADLLRGAYRPPQYERAMLPLVVLRRFDCVLESTKEAVVAAYATHRAKFDDEALDSLLNKVAHQRFHNRSPLTFDKLRGDPQHIQENLNSQLMSKLDVWSVLSEVMNSGSWNKYPMLPFDAASDPLLVAIKGQSISNELKFGPPYGAP